MKFDEESCCFQCTLSLDRSGAFFFRTFFTFYDQTCMVSRCSEDGRCTVMPSPEIRFVVQNEVFLFILFPKIRRFKSRTTSLVLLGCAYSLFYLTASDPSHIGVLSLWICTWFDFLRDVRNRVAITASTSLRFSILAVVAVAFQSRISWILILDSSAMKQWI